MQGLLKGKGLIIFGLFRSMWVYEKIRKVLELYFSCVGISFDKTHFTCNSIILNDIEYHKVCLTNKKSDIIEDITTKKGFYGHVFKTRLLQLVPNKMKNKLQNQRSTRAFIMNLHITFL